MANNECAQQQQVGSSDQIRNSFNKHTIESDQIFTLNTCLACLLRYWLMGKLRAKSLLNALNSITFSSLSFLVTDVFAALCIGLPKAICDPYKKHFNCVALNRLKCREPA